MKASPLLIAWHDDNAPVYSVHFDPNGKGRLATAGNDNNVRLWRVESTKEDQRKVVYLSTLVKHTQAVNVVRFSPKGEMLASAGDDGNVLLWVPSELQTQPGLGEDRSDDQETWRVKHMCRSSGAEIYDLAWSPDGVFIITGSMDNIARIYNAQTGQMVRQIAEHSHYVQGVAWDPLNEFVATQSSDRSVHIYSLKTKDGQFTLTSHGKFLKMDLPARRIPSSSPAPEPSRSQPTSASVTVTSPAPSTPGTPKPSTLPMDPPPVSHSRRSSFSSSSIRRSASPAASMPLPAVKPLEAPSPGINTLNALNTLGIKNANLYANETFTSFFRRLSFAPDGSLLFTPAGQYKTMHVSSTDPSKTQDEIINTVYVYTRAGFSKPPISHLPGHKKPSVAIKCSPIFYTLRQAPQPVKHMTLDTSSGEEAFGTLPDSVVDDADANTDANGNGNGNGNKPKGPHDDTNATITPVFALPYRIVYAVATQDAVMVYDTQQQTPLCVVSNLHFATFTDLTWSNDGLTLIMSSSDGFCSTLTFAPGELGQQYTAPPATQTPLPTPTPAPPAPATTSTPTTTTTTTTTTQVIPPASPARSTSASSNTPTTTPSLSQPASTAAAGSGSGTGTGAGSTPVINNPTPTLGSVPLVTATNSAQPPALPLTTPPQTPLSAVPPSASTSGNASGSGSASVTVLGKREDRESQALSDQARDGNGGSAQAGQTGEQPQKKRRVAPTLVSSSTSGEGNGS